MDSVFNLTNNDYRKNDTKYVQFNPGSLTTIEDINDSIVRTEKSLDILKSQFDSINTSIGKLQNELDVLEKQPQQTQQTQQQQQIERVKSRLRNEYRESENVNNQITRLITNLSDLKKYKNKFDEVENNKTPFTKVYLHTEIEGNTTVLFDSKMIETYLINSVGNIIFNPNYTILYDDLPTSPSNQNNEIFQRSIFLSETEYNKTVIENISKMPNKTIKKIKDIQNIDSNDQLSVQDSLDTVIKVIFTEDSTITIGGNKYIILDTEFKYPLKYHPVYSYYYEKLDELLNVNKGVVLFQNPKIEGKTSKEKYFNIKKILNDKIKELKTKNIVDNEETIKLMETLLRIIDSKYTENSNYVNRLYLDTSKVDDLVYIDPIDYKLDKGGDSLKYPRYEIHVSLSLMEGKRDAGTKCNYKRLEIKNTFNKLYNETSKPKYTYLIKSKDLTVFKEPTVESKQANVRGGTTTARGGTTTARGGTISDIIKMVRNEFRKSSRKTRRKTNK